MSGISEGVEGWSDVGKQRRSEEMGLGEKDGVQGLCTF